MSTFRAHIRALYKVTSNGTITQVPLAIGFTPTVVASGPTGAIWFGGNGEGLGSVTPAGSSTSYDVSGGNISGMAEGADGNLWLTQYGEISRMTAGLAFTEYAITIADSQPQGITSGPDGNLWFTESNGNKVAKLVLSSVPATSLLTISPLSLSFTGEQGGAAPAPQSLSISAPSATTFTASTSAVPWLSITPSGTLTTNQTISVSVNQSANLDNLPVGDDTGVVTLSNGGVSQYVPVSFTVTSASNQITLEGNPTGLTFTYPIGGALPPSQTLQVIATPSGGGSASVPFTAAASSVGNWLSVTPSGTTPATLTVSVAPLGLSAGNYMGSITISGGGVAAGRTVTVSVGLTVQPAPMVQISTAGLTFTAPQGGAAPPAQMFTVTASSPTAFSLNVESVTPWLTVSPTGNLTTNQTITVTANPAGLGACGCGTFIRITWGSSTVNVPVNFNVTLPPAVNVSPASLAYAYQVGGALPQAQTVAVSLYGVINGQQAFTAAVATGGTWLSVSPTSGTTPATLSVQVSPTGLAPGLYNGSVSITPTGGSATSVPVTLTVTGTTTFSASPNVVNFTYSQGGSTPESQTIQVSSAGSGRVAFTATSNATWLTVLPTSGATPVILTLTASVRGLGIGTYAGAISLTPTGGSPLSIPVNLVISAPVTLSPSPSTLNFNYSQGASGPPAQTIQIPSPSSGSVAFTTASGAPWLTASPLAGSTPATLTVAVSGNLATGTYSGTVSVTVGSYIAASIPVTATVGPPTISASPPSLTFTATAGSAAAVTQPIQLSASGSAAVAFTAVASSAGNWLSVSPSSGSTPSILEVSVSPTDLSPGSYSGNVSVSGGALVIPVTMTVTQAAVPIIAGIVNAASYAQANGVGSPVSPGALVAIFTSTLAGAQAANFTTASLPPTLGNVSLTFNNIAAPIVAVSPTGQYPYVSAQVPFEILAAGQTSATVPVVITVNGVPSPAVQESIVPSQPGIFTIPATGLGNAILVFTDPATNQPAIAAPASAGLSYASAPIPRGANGFFYVTGLGEMTPSVPDGSGTCPAANGVCNANATPTVLVGGVPAQVAFAGQAPGFPGVFQVNITIPENAPTGNGVSLVVKSADGMVASNIATIAVQ
jgi:trimeric autotransporter adhesin